MVIEDMIITYQSVLLLTLELSKLLKWPIGIVTFYIRFILFVSRHYLFWFIAEYDYRNILSFWIMHFSKTCYVSITLDIGMC